MEAECGGKGIREDFEDMMPKKLSHPDFRKKFGNVKSFVYLCTAN
ncbi:hypothetical protein BN938_2996 [Mucinivorans hirudinis]|uniref:Uncharacterized protein n=1 Tax=Mucinivorans hirudinis TaxID=1433126 RepID=A0A060RBN1_9BACT|nr:hypothetical protein BN938_2996 [Mucinivorans hirudinis]